MIIYGSKTKELAKEHLIDKCPNCGTQNNLDLYVFQKYAHVFWIPFFPMGKTGISQCNHCKQVLKPKEMPASLSSSYENLKAQTKTPIWTFSGLVLIVILIAAIIISEKKKDEKNGLLIQNPQAGDIFEIKKEGHYTLYKVEEVEGDSVFIRINDYQTNKPSGLRELKTKNSNEYSEDLYGFSKKELKEMLDNGEIIDIDR